jgi:cation diffusion facilitator family transporter
MARTHKRKAGEESMTAIVAAVIGNLLIAVSKFVAAAFTGSSAMVSEGIHSIVDMGNGLLMLFGTYSSQKPPDEEHPFGHGREIYFWSLVVAFSIFGVGGGISVFEGIDHIRHPQPVVDPVWNYAVLGMSFGFEGISWVFGWRAFAKARHGRPVVEAMQASKDPTTFTVLLEDSTALLGIVIAFLGVFLGQQFNIQYFDGAASVVIGLLLGFVALFLGYESKSLLIGEAVDKDTWLGIKQIAEDEPEVVRAIKILTIYLGPEEVAATLELEFKKDISAIELRRTIRRIERLIEERYPRIKRVYYEASSLSERDGGEPLKAKAHPRE